MSEVLFMSTLRFFIAKLIKKMRLPAVKSSTLHSNAKVCSGSTVVSSRVDRYSYIGNDCSILHVDVGSFCSIADNVSIGGGGHPIDRVSTSPVFHSGKNVLKTNFADIEYEPFTRTYIGSDVWIGSGVMVKAGVSVGHGAVIGMGSVLTKNVGPYEVWAGNPAQFIRKRFDDDIISQLLRLSWWDLGDDEIARIAHFFETPNLLLDKANCYESSNGQILL